MRHRLRAATLLLLASALLAISACGQMGPLTLPQETNDSEDEQSDEENER